MQQPQPTNIQDGLTVSFRIPDSFMDSTHRVTTPVGQFSVPAGSYANQTYRERYSVGQIPQEAWSVYADWYAQYRIKKINVRLIHEGTTSQSTKDLKDSTVNIYYCQDPTGLMYGATFPNYGDYVLRNQGCYLSILQLNSKPYMDITVHPHSIQETSDAGHVQGLEPWYPTDQVTIPYYGLTWSQRILNALESPQKLEDFHFVRAEYEYIVEFKTPQVFAHRN